MTDINKSGESLCERSMKMVVSVIKLSSFSIAKMSLGVGTAGRRAPFRILLPTESKSSDSTKHRNFWSQEPRVSSKPVSYLIEPDERTGSSYVVQDVDGKASNYIDRVHKKNRRYFRESSEDYPIILPPPRRAAK